MHKRTMISLSLSALAGAIYFLLLGQAWTYIARYLHTTTWLAVKFQHAEWLYVVLFLHDFLLNIVLAIPLALFICTLRPKSYLSYLVVAILPSVFWGHKHWLFDVDLNSYWLLMVPGLITELFCIPIALIVILRFKYNLTK